jgi:hypothetical protein
MNRQEIKKVLAELTTDISPPPQGGEGITSLQFELTNNSACLRARLGLVRAQWQAITR